MQNPYFLVHDEEILSISSCQNLLFVCFFACFKMNNNSTYKTQASHKEIHKILPTGKASIAGEMQTDEKKNV